MSSIYGDIESDVYLRRFFDFEFQLSEIDSQVFATHLMEELRIGKAFQDLDAAARRPGYMHYYANYRKFLPALWSTLGLSLRDIDYGIRLIALLARNLPLEAYLHPFLVAILIAVKFKDFALYRSLLTGDFRAGDVIDFIESESSPGPYSVDYIAALDSTEGFLYCIDNTNRIDRRAGEAALEELQPLSGDAATRTYSVLSRRAQIATQEQRDRIRGAIIDGQFQSVNRTTLARLGTFIDTYQEHVRR